MVAKRIFLSCVTNEFGSYRAVLADNLTESGAIEVEKQETFRARGEGTLIMLDDYTKSCDYVVHLVGSQTGAITSPADRKPLLERYGYDLLREKLGLTPEIVDELSYTQWEAWLAVLHGRKLFICTPNADARRDYQLIGEEALLQEERQSRHLKLLEMNGRYAEQSLRFSDHNSLCVGLLRSLRPHEGRVESDHVVPKGLLQFDENAAGFYLDLMPPPYYQIGNRAIPEIVQHWKQFFESESPVGSVGVLLGASGSGKSSLFRAGIGPLLYRTSSGRFIETIYIQATAKDFEKKLLATTRSHLNIESLEKHDRLDDFMQDYFALPSSQKRKLLIVIDQFEQWLLFWNKQPDAELVKTLKQNRGALVQYMLVVRDDFWSSVHKFMEVIGEELTPKNHRLLQLFDIEHAEKVLRLFGMAYQKVDATPTQQQTEFIQRAVAGLANENRNEVVCLRLSLFAFMMRSRPWNMSTWTEVGGVEGLGVKFLEDTIGRNSEARLAKHREGAKQVLRCLLPERGTEVKRQLSLAELQTQSGHAEKPSEFSELIRVLHNELRVITLSDGDLNLNNGTSELLTSDSNQYLQLAHDFLVTAVREWLSLTQKSTRSGRAMLLLESRSAAWHLDNKRAAALPSMREYCVIRWQTPKYAWTDNQRQMMRVAKRAFYAKLTATLAGTAAAILLVAAVTFKLRSDAAKDAVATLIGTPFGRIDDQLDSIGQYVYFAVPMLKEAAQEAKASTSKDSKEKRTKCELALLTQGYGDREFLKSMLFDPSSDLNCYQAIRRAFEANSVSNETELSSLIANEWDPAKYCRLLLAGDEQFQLSQARRDPRTCARMIASIPFQDLPLLREGLSPTTIAALRSELINVFQAESSDAVLKSGVVYVLAAGMPNDPLADKTRCCLVIAADSKKNFDLAIQSAVSQPSTLQLLKELMVARSRLRDRSFKGPERDEAQARLNEAWQETGFDSQFLSAHTDELDAASIVGLAILGEFDELWKLLRDERAYSLRSQVIHLIAELGVDRGKLIDRLLAEIAAGGAKYNEFEVAGLLLALGRKVEHLPENEKQRLVEGVASRLTNASSPYVISSAEWLLSQLDVPLAIAKHTPATPSSRWYVNQSGQRFAKVDTEHPSLKSLISLKNNPTQYRKIVVDAGWPVRPFWCSVYEVTVADWRNYIEACGRTLELPANRWKNAIYPTPPDNCPIGGVRRRDVLGYCNWLSEQEGLKPFYKPIENNDFSGNFRATHSSGYRVPFDYEWELASRGGCDLLRFYGSSEALISQYAYCNKPSETGLFAEVGRVMPNTLGLFDTLGNAMEWVHNPSAMKAQGNILGMQLKGGAYLIHPPNIDHHSFKERKEDKSSSELGDWVDGIRLVRWID